MKSVHDTIASDAFPNGAWLYCANPQCDRGEKASSEDCARYLASGWPMHCGMTMGLNPSVALSELRPNHLNNSTEGGIKVIANQTARSLFESEGMRAALATPVLAGWPEDATYHEAEQPTAIGRELIATVHRHLLGSTIAYVFRETMSEKDKTTLAKASKAGTKLAFFTGFDLCIDVNHEAWLKLTAEQRVALIDHELCHFGVEDTDKGTRFVLLAHDVEEFGSIVNRWGLWKPDLRIFARIVADQHDLFADSNSTVTLKGGGEEVTMTGREFADVSDRIASKGL